MKFLTCLSEEFQQQSFLVYRDAFVVSIGNCLTSFFAGFVIFGIIGFMAHELGLPVEKVAVQGKQQIVSNYISSWSSLRIAYPKGNLATECSINDPEFQFSE